MAGVALQDFPHAKLIVLWGVNPSATGIHLVPYSRRRRSAGAQLVVDRSRAARRSPGRPTCTSRSRPGTDLALALAVISLAVRDGAGRSRLPRRARDRRRGAAAARRAWTFERAAEVAGVAAADIERFARLYAESSPAVVRCGWGLERNRNGGSAVAAVLALPAVAGKFGVRGGGYTMSNSASWGIDQAPAVADAAAPATRIVNMNRLGEALLEARPAGRGAVRLQLQPARDGAGPERVRRGLAREDLFTVVFEQVLTDTARYADVVLPATTFLEHHELVARLRRLRAASVAAGGRAGGRGALQQRGVRRAGRRLGLDKPATRDRRAS